MNTAIALVIIFGWCLLVWSVNQCLKPPTIHEKRRPR